MEQSYRDEQKKRLDIEIELKNAKKIIEKLENENEILKSKISHLENNLSQNDHCTAKLIAESTVSLTEYFTN